MGHTKDGRRAADLTVAVIARAYRVEAGVVLTDSAIARRVVPGGVDVDPYHPSSSEPGALDTIRIVIRELLPPNTARAFEAMRELRPFLTDKDDFVTRVDKTQRPAGYRLVAVVADDSSETSPALAVAGFRVSDNLPWGHHLYVDDLSTLLSARNQGHAGSLLSWIEAEATRLGCGQIQLDSGVGINRAAAHRLYLNHGFRISSHHFTHTLD